MMRCGARFDANQARRQLLKERQDVAALQLTANDHLAFRVNAVHLKYRLRNVETDGCDRLHDWLLRIVGALTAPTSLALMCRWRSRPQHQERTFKRTGRLPLSVQRVHSDWPPKPLMSLYVNEAGRVRIGIDFVTC